MSNLDVPMPAVVLSGGVTALGVIRSFGRRGVPVRVHPVTHDVVRHSRWHRPLIESDSPQAAVAPSLAGLRDVLAQSGLKQGFLCACGDDWNRVVAEYAEAGTSEFVCVVPARLALDRLQDKGRLALLLQELEVPLPLTRLIRDERDLQSLPDSSETFYFLKPTDSQSFLARFKTKGMKVRSAEEARARLAEIVKAGMSVVLQEYIPGPPSEHCFVDGYLDRGGEVRALFARRRLRIYPPDFGNSTAMVSVALDSVAQAVESVRRVLAAVGYMGIFSAEFKRDHRDDQFKLLEVNTRPWWFIDFAARCGVDVCQLAYDDAQGKQLASVTDYRVGATCIYPYFDFFAAQPLLKSGSLTWRQWTGELMAALQPVGCWDDPLPGVVGFSRVIGTALRNRLRGSAAH